MPLGIPGQECPLAKCTGMDDWEEWLALLQKYNFLLDPAMYIVDRNLYRVEKRVILMEACISEFASPFQYKPGFTKVRVISEPVFVSAYGAWVGFAEPSWTSPWMMDRGHHLERGNQEVGMEERKERREAEGMKGWEWIWDLGLCAVRALYLMSGICQGTVFPDGELSGEERTNKPLGFLSELQVAVLCFLWLTDYFILAPKAFIYPPVTKQEQ